MIAVTALLLITVAGAAAWRMLRAKAMDLWLPAYLQRRVEMADGLIHVLVCVADHFEPQWNNPPYEQECARVDAWLTRYPAHASGHRDADGRHPQHTFFFPEEEYRPEHLNKLAELRRRGLGDVEIHLHHDGDSPDQLRTKLTRFKTILYERHGLLRRDAVSGDIAYAFIHGNWALCNSASGRWCGVNDELSILRETGCYVDMTLPSAPSTTQTRKINAIYYASSNPSAQKSHDTGIDVETGKAASGDLMLIQGPLALNWMARKLGVLPRIENGELTADNPPSPERADLWVRQAIHVKGRPDWLFVKLHTHGANERHARVLLGPSMEGLWAYLERRYNDGVRYALHYVTAREMYNIVKAAEAGRAGNPGAYRTYGESTSAAIAFAETA